MTKFRPIEVSPGITRTPDVCGGAACVKGTRMTIWALRDFGVSGGDHNFIRKVKEQYPHLTQDQILAARIYLTYRLSEVEADAALHGQDDDG